MRRPDRPKDAPALGAAGRVRAVFAFLRACCTAALAGGCALGGAPRVAPVPPAASALFAEARAALGVPAPDARARARAGAFEALALAPGWVAPRRLLDDLALEDLLGPEALGDHLAALARDPGDAARLYLAGRLERSGERFAAALQADRHLAWAHHGLAYEAAIRGDDEGAARHERRALVRAREPGERAFFARSLARALGQLHRHEDAAEVLREQLAAPALAPTDRASLRAELARSELAALLGPLAERGFDRGLAVLREEDLDVGALAALVVALLEAPAGRTRDQARGEISAALAVRLGPGRDRLRGELLLDAGRDRLALALLASDGWAPGVRVESYEAWRADPSGAQHDGGVELRSARLAAGRAGDALALWLASQPRAVLAADGLPRDGDLRALVVASRALAAPQASAFDAIAFGEALLVAGWFREAQAWAEHLAASDLRAAGRLHARASSGRATIDALERLLRAVEDGRPWPNADERSGGAVVDDLDELLAAMEPVFGAHRAALRALGDGDANGGGHAPAVDEPEGSLADVSPRLSYGPAAEVVHPGPLFSLEDERRGAGVAGEPVPGVARELAALGRFGVFGEAIGTGGPDGTVLRRLWYEERAGEHLGVPWWGSAVWCEGYDVPSRPVRHGAVLSGAAVHAGYWIDVDVVRSEWRRWHALELAFVRAGDAERAERAVSVRPLPLAGIVEPVGEGAGRARLVPLLGEANRVRLALLLERLRARPRGDASAVTSAEPLVSLDELLEGVAAHEEGHLCDRTRFLPLARNWLEILVLLAREGFSARAIGRRLEYRAQVTALCVVPDPRTVLAETLSLAEAREIAVLPHAEAYATLVRDLLVELDRRLTEEPERWPALDPRAYLAHQLHRLAPQEVRALALALAEREGLVAP